MKKKRKERKKKRKRKTEKFHQINGMKNERIREEDRRRPEEE